MSDKVTVDRAGRVVIPKALRRELEIAPGDNLELQHEGDRMVLRPMRRRAALEKERGIWVFRSGERLSAAEVRAELLRTRENRVRRNLGGGD
jgi:AbrB family looped-hinge helix DNA binding protein